MDHKLRTDSESFSDDLSTRCRSGDSSICLQEHQETRCQGQVRIFLALLLAASLTTGCSSLFPKAVEFGQDKVKSFPSHPKAQLESERQAIALAAEKAREAERIATEDDSLAAKPAGEAANLSESVSRSIGPPSAPWKGEVKALTERLDRLTSKYNNLLQSFKKDNDENAGKKIEGTGFLQVPYFLWLGIVAAVIAIIWLVLKTVVNVAAAGNPGVAVGLKVAQVGGKALSRGFSQLISGGENFKNWLKKEVPDDALQSKILEAFKQHHETAQDSDIKELVKNLTK